MGLVFDDAEMEGQLERSLTAVHATSSDLGEAIATARRIEPGNYDDWFAAWSATARRAEERAKSALLGGHQVSARQGFLRASEYWRQAIFFIRHDLDDQRLQEAWHAHRESFRAAIPLFEHEVVVADITLGTGRMGAYLFRSNLLGEGQPRPVVLAPCGYDSTAEAGYAATAYMALRHGYDCLVWEGPGQGGMLYDQRIPMRPDFENVLTPVVDWLLQRPDVDPDALAVIGRSFGGYLAPRGVSGEPRVSALVCDPGQYDVVSRVLGTLFDQDYWERVLAADPEVEAELQKRLDDPHGREYFGARMTTMGAESLGDFLRLQPAYTLEGRAELIRCPVLVTEGEGDFASQSRTLYDALSCPKELKLFTEAEGAGGHCEGLGATLFEEVTFDWLDTILSLRSSLNSGS